MIINFQEDRKMKIQDIMKLSAEIQNFYDCYAEGDSLYAKRQSDGSIQAEDLLEFLIENSHLAKIALRIKESK